MTSHQMKRSNTTSYYRQSKHTSNSMRDSSMDNPSIIFRSHNSHNFQDDTASVTRPQTLRDINLDNVNNRSQTLRQFVTESTYGADVNNNLRTSSVTPQPEPVMRHPQRSPVDVSRDEFSIYGSFTRSKNERRDEAIRQSTYHHQREVREQNYRNLPTKERASHSPIPPPSSAQNYKYSMSMDNESSGFATPVIEKVMKPIELKTEFASPVKMSYNETEGIPASEQVSFTKMSFMTQAESPMSPGSNEGDKIPKLTKKLDRANAKIQSLQQTNSELQSHLKNLLDERKSLMSQIANSEFEEIIEEEEVRAKPRDVLVATPTPPEMSPPKEIIKEVVKEVIPPNYVDRTTLTINDIPQNVIEKYRANIISDEREKMEMEKRTLVESIKFQQQQKYQEIESDIKSQHESLVQSISRDYIDKTQVTVNDLSPNERERYEKEIKERLETVNQSTIRTIKEDYETKIQRLESKIQRIPLDYIEKNKITIENISEYELDKYRRSIINAERERLDLEKDTALKLIKEQYKNQINKLENEIQAKRVVTISDSTQTTTEKMRFRNSALDFNYTPAKPANRSVGISNTTVLVSKTTMTSAPKLSDTAVGVILDSLVKPDIAHKSINVKPDVLQKASQPDESYRFETGTMTDQLFYRSQGVMTTNELDGIKSPESDLEAHVTRTTNRQVYSQMTIVKSPTREANTVIETKQSTPIKLNIPIFTESKSTTAEATDQETKYVKKPATVIEEWEEKILEKHEHLTSHLDKNQKPVENIPTIIECWETVSKIRDGEVVETSEMYHDKVVTTDPEKVRKHLERHERSSSYSSNDMSSPMDAKSFVTFKEQMSQEFSTPFEKTGEAFVKVSTSTKDAVVTDEVDAKTASTLESSVKSSRSSVNDKIIQRSTEESVVNKSFVKPAENAKVENTTTVTKKIPINVTIRQQTTAQNEEPINVEESTKTKSFTAITSPITFESFSSRSSQSMSTKTSTMTTATNSSTIVRSNENFSSSEISKDKKESMKSEQRSIPINVNKTQTALTMDNNLIQNNLSNSSIASANSAFSSVFSKKLIRGNSTGGGSEISFSLDKDNVDSYQILLPDNICQCCNQLLMWIKEFSQLSESLNLQIPDDLKDVRDVVVDWWSDMCLKLDCKQLTSTIQYMFSTFSKNLMKFISINKDRQGNTALHYVIGHERWEIFNILNRYDLVDANIFNSQGFTPLMVCASTDDSKPLMLETLLRLVEKANVNLRSTEKGQTALFIAATHNRPSTIRILITNRAEINIRDNDDNTPLMIACKLGNIDVITVLLNSVGVLTQLRNKEGRTALQIAEESNYSGTIAALFEQQRSSRSFKSSGHSKIMTQNFRVTSLPNRTNQNI